MRKEFTMRCNEEQFQSVLPAIIQYVIDYSEVKFDNDRCFVHFNPKSNSLLTLSSNEVLGHSFLNSFHYNTFLGRISGLDWLEPKKHTLEDLMEKKPYPPSMQYFFSIDTAKGESEYVKEKRMHRQGIGNLPSKDENGYSIHYAAVPEQQAKIVLDPTHINPEFHISFFPKKESPISSGINISAGNAALAYMEFKKTHPDIEPFCIHDKSQL